MDYQILALDLDGTLTNSQKEISAPTLEALIDIQKQGKKVVLASGRPTKGIVHLAEQLLLHEYGGYILSFNGARIIDWRTKQLMYNRTLPMDVAEPLFHMVNTYKDKGLDIVTYTDDSLLSGVNANQYTKLESQINGMAVVPVENFPSHITEPINKLLITGDPEVIKDVKTEIIHQFRSYLSVYNSESFFLEIMPPGIDKAHSLLKLLISIGLTADEMICCGDGDNDVTMIETAGLGVAMANAQPGVLKRADYVTKSNDEDGVLHVVNKFMR